MKIYCSSCGAGTSYSMQKPNFCSGCGKPYVASTAKTKPVRKVVQQVVEEDYEDALDMIDELRADKRGQYKNKFNRDREGLIKDIEEKFGIEYVP